MNDHDTTGPARPRPPRTGGEDYTTTEGLRSMLYRLHRAGPSAWRDDPTASQLMTYAADKYASLARKHGLDPWEAAAAAFDAMRNRSTRRARDPWAVITHAVRVTCIAEERGQGLLCSVHQARRPTYSSFHDPERFSDREQALADYHPAFHYVDDALDEADDAREQAVGSATAVVEDAISLFVRRGWPSDTARAAVEHVCGALVRTGSRSTAYESLRRDKYARTMLDLPRASWKAVLRIVLGNPHPAYGVTPLGRGILLRLLLGETLESLLAEDDLALAMTLAAPRFGTRELGE